jgi:hypothetical protein
MIFTKFSIILGTFKKKYSRCFMNNTEIIQKIIKHIGLAQEGITSYDELYSSPLPDNAQHEYLFFIKPEITQYAESIDLQAILTMMFGKFTQFKLIVKDIRLLGASYLEKFDIIARHYGVINALSRKPRELLSDEAVEKFKAIYGKTSVEINMLGSLEFLQHFPDYTPFSLDELWQKSKSEKLAGGTYCAVVAVQGKEVFLINGFHPRQLIHFTEKGRSIVAFTLTGDLDWSIARNNFIGKTNPAEALSGSLRNELLNHHQTFGLQTVSSSQNGFHLSAGPVEGLVELIRYCSDYSTNRIKTTDDFFFGRTLKGLFSEAEIRQICENQLVTFKGKKISTFDLTEEKNGSTALVLLKESVF